MFSWFPGSHESNTHMHIYKSVHAEDIVRHVRSTIHVMLYRWCILEMLQASVVTDERWGHWLNITAVCTVCVCVRACLCMHIYRCVLCVISGYLCRAVLVSVGLFLSRGGYRLGHSVCDPHFFWSQPDWNTLAVPLAVHKTLAQHHCSQLQLENCLFTVVAVFWFVTHQAQASLFIHQCKEQGDSLLFGSEFLF